MCPSKFTGISNHTVENSSGYGVAPQKRLDIDTYAFALLFPVRLVSVIFSRSDGITHHPNRHKNAYFKPYSCSWVFAAEQKARTTYDNILRLVDDPDIREPIKFLRQREIVHFQRFGEALRTVQDHLDSNNFYAFNPAFDPQSKRK